MPTFAQTFAGVFVALLWALLLARILLSWFDRRGAWRISRVAIGLTEPLLVQLRRLIPTTGGVDFASLVMLVLLGVLWRALL